MRQFLCMLLAAALLTCQVKAQKTEFGVMSAGVEASRADAALMGVDLVRNHVSVSSGNGVKQMLPGVRYFTNICWKQGEFPDTIAVYEAKLRALVKTMLVLPYMVAGENEENMNGDNARYLEMMQVLRRVFEPLGVKVCNGGITDGAAVALAYDYYMRARDKATASYLASRNKKAGQQIFARVKQEVDYLRTMPTVDFNFHYQLKDSSFAKDLQLIVAALQETTGKTVVNNELAQRDYSLATTVAMVNAAKCMPVVVLYTTTGKAGNATTFTPKMKLAAGAAIKQ